MTPRKTSAKTSRRVPAHGKGELNVGNPGNKGGTGRPPDAFRAMCAALASSDDVEKNVRLILTKPDHPLYLGALKWASEHGYGKPMQPVQVGGLEKIADAMLAAEARLAGR